jgi:hypothetical protein
MASLRLFDEAKHSHLSNRSCSGDKKYALLWPLQVPPNGLVIYTGTVMTEDGKEKKLNIDFEPFKPINTSLYLCDNKFHTEALNELLESDSKCALLPLCSVPPACHDLSPCPMALLSFLACSAQATIWSTV